tara:strand:+ start:141 stop:302 length:162 start_codon:yes stop_codon:yes gene_type:complete
VEQSNKLIASLQKVTDKITQAIKRERPTQPKTVAKKRVQKKVAIGPLVKRRRA